MPCRMIKARHSNAIVLDNHRYYGKSYAHKATMRRMFSKNCSAGLSGYREILIFVMGLLAFWPLTLPAQENVTLAWNPSASPSNSIAGYAILYGNDGVHFPWIAAAGTNTTVTVSNLPPGTPYYFEAVTYDQLGNKSAPSPSLKYLIVNSAAAATIVGPITNTVLGTGTSNADTGFSLLMSGRGTILPSHKAQTYQAGKQYTLTASPARGSVLAYWASNNIVVTNFPKYTFTIGSSNLVLQAVFTNTPFTNTVTTYHGLFYVITTNVAEDSTNASSFIAADAENSSGSFTATVSTTGSFTAKVQMAGQTYPYTGQFPAPFPSNTVSVALPKSIARPRGQGFIMVSNLALDLSLTNSPMTGYITGTNNNVPWVAPLLAYPNVYSRTNQATNWAGKYTMVIPGSTNTSEPGGHGFGAVTVSELGAVSFSGILGDGTTVTSTSTVCSEGQLPFYVSLYAGKGSILGWLFFTSDDTNSIYLGSLPLTNNNANCISGQLSWFQSQPTAKIYPSGFAYTAVVLGSSYTSDLQYFGLANSFLFGLTNGSLGITNQVTFGLPDVASDSGGDKLTFRTATGVFKGTVKNPGGSPIPVNGIVLQNQNVGAGYFLGSDDSGSVLLSPVP